jgi:hypothetical protein
MGQAKREKKQQEEEGGKEEEEDYLAPVMAKLQLDKLRDYKKGTPFTAEQAKLIQSEAFQMHKDRIKARAKIIQDRLDAEVKAVQKQFVLSPGTWIGGNDKQSRQDGPGPEGEIPERL